MYVPAPYLVCPQEGACLNCIYYELLILGEVVHGFRRTSRNGNSIFGALLIIGDACHRSIVHNQNDILVITQILSGFLATGAARNWGRCLQSVVQNIEGISGQKVVPAKALAPSTVDVILLHWLRFPFACDETRLSFGSLPPVGIHPFISATLRRQGIFREPRGKFWCYAHHLLVDLVGSRRHDLFSRCGSSLSLCLQLARPSLLLFQGRNRRCLQNKDTLWLLDFTISKPTPNRYVRCADSIQSVAGRRTGTAAMGPWGEMSKHKNSSRTVCPSKFPLAHFICCSFIFVLIGQGRQGRPQRPTPTATTSTSLVCS